MHPDFLAKLKSPTSHEPLVLNSTGGTFNDSRHQYPILDGVPFLMPEPALNVAQWQLRLKAELQNLHEKAADVSYSLEEDNVTELTRERLSALLAGFQCQAQSLLKILSPLFSGGEQKAGEAFAGALHQITSDQQIFSYGVNLFRDWQWGIDENTLMLKHCQSLWRGAKDVLTIGAGACRLSYDLHKHFKPNISVAMDINPLFLFSAQNLLKNRSKFQLVEMPFAPRALKDVAVIHNFAPPDEDHAKGFELVFGDSRCPPFKNASFDLVLTPWFVDIQPEPLNLFINRINQLLPMNGQWINFGSVAFHSASAAGQLSHDEVFDIVTKQGFKIEQTLTVEIPYLRSPHQAGSRIENVLFFSAVKTAKISESVSPPALPPWLDNLKEAVPALPIFSAFATSHKILGDVADQINGKLSINSIGRYVARKYRMSDNEGVASVRQLLRKIYEDNLRRKPY